MKKFLKVGCGCFTVLVGLVIVIALLAVFFAPGNESEPSTSTNPTVSRSDVGSPELTPATFTATIDGDTIETSEGVVRLIGIDTPERGECGHDEASEMIWGLLRPGDAITLRLPEGQNDKDRHDRLLRYVDTATGVDIGLSQLEAGHAVARYDSRDGYPKHPKEEAYHRAQIAALTVNGSVSTTPCQVRGLSAPAPSAESSAEPAEEPSPEVTAAPAPALEPSPSKPWWQQYASCARLKKNEVGHPIGPFNRDDPEQAEIYNWFQYGTGYSGDGDGDGLACE